MNIEDSINYFKKWYKTDKKLEKLVSAIAVSGVVFTIATIVNFLSIAMAIFMKSALLTMIFSSIAICSGCVLIGAGSKYKKLSRKNDNIADEFLELTGKLLPETEEEMCKILEKEWTKETEEIVEVYEPDMEIVDSNEKVITMTHTETLSRPKQLRKTLTK